MLTSPQKHQLLQLARQSVTAHLSNQALPTAALPDRELNAQAGAFVSVHQRGSHALRGCIGRITATEPLAQTVQAMALACCFEDPRFPPVELAELENLFFEISVLTPPKRIENISELTIGRHGLIVSAKGQRGLLLPQVATQYDWSREEFLRQTCLKAGLDIQAWQRPETVIESFAAIVFSEESEHEH